MKKISLMLLIGLLLAVSIPVLAEEAPATPAEAPAPPPQEEPAWSPSWVVTGQTATHFSLYRTDELFAKSVDGDMRAFGMQRFQIGVKGEVAPNTNIAMIFRMESTLNDITFAGKLIQCQFDTLLFDLLQIRVGRLLNKFNQSMFFGRFAWFGNVSTFRRNFLVPVFVNDAAELIVRLDKSGIPINITAGWQYSYSPVATSLIYFVVKANPSFGESMKLIAHAGVSIKPYDGADADTVRDDLSNKFELDLAMEMMKMLTPYINFGVDFDGMETGSQLGFGIHLKPKEILPDLGAFSIPMLALEFDIDSLSPTDPETITDHFEMYLHLTMAYQGVIFDWGLTGNFADFGGSLTNYFRFTVKY